MFQATTSGHSTRTSIQGEGSALLARDVGKAYRIYDKPIHRLWDLILPYKERGREFWAVRNVYLDITKCPN